MGCFGEREKLEEAHAEQKWDYIVSLPPCTCCLYADLSAQNLRDFKSTSCYSPLSYGVLYILLAISVAVYAVDLFTAINLLVFDRWSGQVKPVISFKIARWIFAACILLSWILLVYRWIRAVRVMKSGVIAASYLDPLAVEVQSIRTGSRGQGWRRFLVFAALTKGRKGAEYVALFVHFSFEGELESFLSRCIHTDPLAAWLRIIFAEGPRQVINALTLYSVMRADLLPAGDHGASGGHSPISQFWSNISILANRNREQAAILFGMLFTLIIWLFSAISLIIACLMYVVFLWHHIPKSDGTLARYCRRKVDSRLAKIVGAKVSKALAKEDKIRAKEAAKAGGTSWQIKRQPTLPIVDDEGEQIPNHGVLSRRTTETTMMSRLSETSSENAANQRPTIPEAYSAAHRPNGPSRSTTQSSAWSNESFGSDAPLLGAAAATGYGAPGHANSNPPPLRMASDRSIQRGEPPYRTIPRGNSQSTQPSYNPAWSTQRATGRNTPEDALLNPYAQQKSNILGRRPTVDFQGHTPTHRNPPPNNYDRQLPPPTQNTFRQTPAQEELEMHHRRTRPFLNPPPSNDNNSNPAGRYIAYNPTIHGRPQLESQNPPPPQLLPPIRNFTLPTSHRLPADHFNLHPPPQRSGTAPIPHTAAAVHNGRGFDFFDDDDVKPPTPLKVPARPATAAAGLARKSTAAAVYGRY